MLFHQVVAFPLKIKNALSDTFVPRDGCLSQGPSASARLSKLLILPRYSSVFSFCPLLRFIILNITIWDVMHFLLSFSNLPVTKFLRAQHGWRPRPRYIPKRVLLAGHLRTLYHTTNKQHPPSIGAECRYIVDPRDDLLLSYFCAQS